MLTLAFNIQSAKAEWTWTETIYIRADGSVDPDTAPILSVDNITYTLTDNIIGDVPEETSAVWVMRDDIVVDGAGYALQGTGALGSKGIDLTGRENVTVRNTQIKNFYYGIGLEDSTNNSISGNTIANNGRGIWLDDASNNSIGGNNVTANSEAGIALPYSSNNSISGNNVANNYAGISLYDSSNNSINGNTMTANNHVGILLYDSSNNSINGNTMTANNYVGIQLHDSSNNSINGNNIANNYAGILLQHSSNYNSISGNTITANNYAGIWLDIASNNSIGGNTIAANNEVGIRVRYSTNNTIDHNNFIDNGMQVDNYASTNVWDDGYPSGGNYWSDYTTRYPDAQEIDDSGIWDTPYVIDEHNQDNYPLMEPWTPPPPIPTTIRELKTEIERCWSEGEVDNQGIVKSLIAKLNAAQKLVDKGKIAQAQSILENGFIPQVQNLSGICIAVEAADVLIQSAEYILSNL
jgi:parallel beta-helix repeat protein